MGWVEGVGCFSAGAGCGHAQQYRPVKESGMAPGAQVSVDLHLYGCRNYLQAGTWQWRPAGVGASDVQIHGTGQLQVHTLARAVRGTGTSTQCVSHCGCLGCWPGLVSCRGQRRACTQQRRAATGVRTSTMEVPTCRHWRGHAHSCGAGYEHASVQPLSLGLAAGAGSGPRASAVALAGASGGRERCWGA